MNKSKLLTYLQQIDQALQQPAMLYIYGSAACILLDEPERTSLDIDVAAPYSQADYGDIVQAADIAGLPINPEEEYSSNHIEWIQSLRLCLPKPTEGKSMVLWQGSKLTIKSAAIADLIASKLIRYDDIDQGDIQYLYTQARITISDIEESVRKLPPPFESDVLIQENLQNLRLDLKIWNAGEQA